MQLRPRARVVIEDTPSQSTQKRLRGQDVRPGGDDDNYACSICLVNLQMRDGHADWSQCPTCRHVFHGRCIHGHVRTSTLDDEFACPMCKTKYSVDDLDEWYAVDLMDKVRDDDSAYEDDVDKDEPEVEPDRKLRSRK